MHLMPMEIIPTMKTVVSSATSAVVAATSTAATTASPMTVTLTPGLPTTLAFTQPLIVVAEVAHVEPARWSVFKLAGSVTITALMFIIVVGIALLSVTLIVLACQRLWDWFAETMPTRRPPYHLATHEQLGHRARRDRLESWDSSSTLADPPVGTYQAMDRDEWRSQLRESWEILEAWESWLLDTARAESPPPYYNV